MLPMTVTFVVALLVASDSATRVVAIVVFGLTVGGFFVTVATISGATR